MKKAIKIILRIVLILLLVLILAVGGYVLYVQMQYYRIEDNAPLDIINPASQQIEKGKEYSAVTSNIGFGAYDHDYTFFLDTGTMKDGTKTVGTHGRASGKEAARRNTDNAVAALQKLKANFYLVQEVDTNSTRAYHINQMEALTKAMPSHSASFALNFHSAYLAYPFLDMHGKTEAGLLTLSDKAIAEAWSRSYPVDNSFFTKFFDLDRCFAVSRLPIKDGTELVLINSHMSAYDKGGTIRAQQLSMLNDVLAEERAKGNYVIVGGDFNHALGGTVDAFPSAQQIPPWVFEFSDKDLPEGFRVATAENDHEVATCRGCDIPYTKGTTYVTVVDGFIVSDNISAKAENIDEDFVFSDHNPVKLTFTLD
ncbi:MAG: endonuclease [Oscillospiraceae bacterium]